MIRILVVEDHKETRFLIQAALGFDHGLVFCSSADEARIELGQSQFDMILLDVTLPGGEDGFGFCASLQADARTSAIPIIFLTGRSSIADKVIGLSLGAEDYIEKPFAPAELRARIDMRLKKIASAAGAAETLRKGDLLLHLPSQSATRIVGTEARDLGLTPLEFKLLLHLARHENEPFARKELLQLLWHGTVTVVERTIDVHLGNIRRKLSGSDYTVESVKGVGYVFRRKS